MLAVPETYREFVKRRFAEEGSPRSLEESARMLSDFAAEWRGRGSGNMATNRNERSFARRPKGLALMRASTTQSAANAFVSVDINTPVNIESRYALRIHKVAFELVRTEKPGDGAADTTTQLFHEAALSTRQGLTAVPTLSDAGTIAKVREEAYYTGGNAVGNTSGGPAAVSATNHLPGVWDFGDTGVLVVDRTLTLYYDSDSMALANTVRCVIYYSLERLDSEEFMIALSSVETL